MSQRNRLYLRILIAVVLLAAGVKSIISDDMITAMIFILAGAVFGGTVAREYFRANKPQQ